jgi:hypothetical protein
VKLLKRSGEEFKRRAKKREDEEGIMKERRREGHGSELTSHTVAADET